MNIINSKDTLIENIVGKQNFNTSLKYRWLYFCFFKIEEEKLLIFNNLTREFIILNKNEFAIGQNNTYIVSSELYEFFVTNWFMVPEDFNDISFYNEIKQVMLNFSKTNKAVTFFDILTTTACNARCYYCFESDSKKVTMTQETALAVAKYIINNSKNQPVRLYWFGGEPLCNFQVINFICEYLEKNKINFSSGMVSNAYLFDDKLIESADKVWKMNYVQITLDGTEKNYNRIKNYANNDNNPFERVIENIGKLLEKGIYVRIRLNMDKSNYTDLYDLIDFLEERFAHYDNFSVYSNIIFESCGFVKTERTDFEREEIGILHLKMQEYLRDHNLLKSRKVSPYLSVYSCMADDHRKVLISPEGKLGNCEHHVDDDFFGDVFNNDSVKPWNEYLTDLPECATCSVYPTCHRLKKCHPGRERVCYPFERNRKKWDIYESMRVSYYRYKRKNNN